MTALLQRTGDNLLCSKCARVLPLSEFRRRSTGRWHSWCVDCKRSLDRDAAKRPPLTAEQKARKRELASQQARLRVRAHGPSPKPPTTPPPASAPPSPPAMVRTASPGRACCQWPLFDDSTPKRERRFCGLPVERGSWCEHHLRVVYVNRSAA